MREISKTRPFFRHVELESVQVPNTGRASISLRVLALTAGALAMLASPLAAQTVNPTKATFEPSSDHNALDPLGSPIVQSYQLDFFLTGAVAPFQSVPIGKPNPGGGGTIVVDLTTMLVGWPVPGTNYFAKVAAVGASGSAWSAASNTFTFAGVSSPLPPPPPSSSCVFDVYPRSLTVGSGASSQSTAVSTTADCTWTATSNAGWISVTGSATRTGPVLATFDIGGNTGGTRTGTLTVAGVVVTISQSGSTSGGPSAPTNFRVSP